MKPLFRLGALALLGTLSGCAVLDKPEMDAVRASHVEPYLIDKIRHADPLNPGDIIQLTRHGVADDILIRYIERTGVDFPLTRQIGERMHAAGVSVRVLRVISYESRRYVEGYAAPRVYVEPYYYPSTVVIGPGYHHYRHW
jgi:hypothetical protein